MRDYLLHSACEGLDARSGEFAHGLWFNQLEQEKCSTLVVYLLL